ncbi:MAG TPA: terminase family protein [Croceibacterium sp.]|nr:terminase family protein [Croceibacterium sp.]
MAGSDQLEWLLSLGHDERRAVLRRLGDDQLDELLTEWRLWAHPGQVPPAKGWHTWLIMAGRGYGKTRAGAEWVRAIAEADPAARIALVGASLGETRRVMVEGESGLLAIARPKNRPVYEPSKRQLNWPNGAIATLYSAGEPDSLRGPQHSHAWCDEIAKWDHAGGRAEAAWDNLVLGLRLGLAPAVVATTTPRAVSLVKRLLGQSDALVTRGTTADNKDNLPPGFFRQVRVQFGRSLLGRQELGGELIEEIDGALWSRALLEHCREAAASAPARRVVIGVDPPASAAGDACGIVVCALGEDGIARVLADCSVRKATPERWARAVASAARGWQADRVIAEANNGGEMVRSVLHAADISLPVKLVHASRGKAARAEPVAALYESGRVRHVGQLPQLEDELCALMAGGTYEGPGRSPDRADALVWALSELMLGRKSAPRVRAI